MLAKMQVIHTMAPDFNRFRRCVGAAILKKDEAKVLVAQRIDSVGAYWQMPQGGMEEGETHAESALREVQEELGIKHEQLALMECLSGWFCYALPKDLSSRLWGGRFVGQAQKWLVFRAKEDIDSLSLNFFEEPEFAAWKWIDVERLEAVAIPFKKAIYHKVSQGIINSNSGTIEYENRV